MEPVTFLVVGLSLAQQVPLRGTSITQETPCRTSLIEPSFSPSRKAHMRNKRPMRWSCFRKKSIITMICLERYEQRIQLSISAYVLTKRLLHLKVESFQQAWYKMQLTLFILQFHCKVSISTLSPMQAQMTSRLLSVLDQNGLTMATLGLDGRQALQVGLCSLYLQNLNWAESAFESHIRHCLETRLCCKVSKLLFSKRMMFYGSIG